MKVHRKQIPPEGLQVKGEEECPISELEAEGIRCLGPLRYNLDVGVSNGALWAKGSLEQTVVLRCVTCLKSFNHEIRVPAFALHTDLPGPEIIDLTPFIREEILLNLPAHPHCDRDGGQICEVTQAKTGEPDAKGKADWSALDKLRIEKR